MNGAVGQDRQIERAVINERTVEEREARNIGQAERDIAALYIAKDDISEHVVAVGDDNAVALIRILRSKQIPRDQRDIAGRAAAGARQVSDPDAAAAGT